VKEAGDAIQPLTSEQIDDIIGDFWLRLLEDDMRRLRAFKPSHGGALLSWMTMQVSHVAYEQIRRLSRDSGLVSLDDAAELPSTSRANPRRQAAQRNDVSGLAQLLQLPVEVQALRAEVVRLRATLEQLRRSLPPALLSVGDAARSLGISEVTVRRMIRRGELAHVRIGRSVKVDLSRAPIESVNSAP
jgi:excisionase family DNA binding protein